MKSYVLIIFIRTLILRRQVITEPLKVLADSMPGLSIPQGSLLRKPNIHFIVPFRDQAELTKICVDGLLRLKRDNWRITLVNNGSEKPETFTWLQQLDDPAISIMDYPGAFNFSSMMNAAVAKEPGFEYTVFVNNDLEFEGDQLVKYLEAGIRLDSAVKFGALGSTLVFPDRTIQHLFVATGVKLVAAHPMRCRNIAPNCPWFESKIRQVPAVTGALYMVNTELFKSVGGFDPGLPTAYQDVDLCLRIRKSGFGIYTYTPVVAVHHESVTRKKDNPVEQMRVMYERWGTDLTADEGYPIEFSRWSEKPLLRWKEGAFPFRSA